MKWVVLGGQSVFLSHCSARYAGWNTDALTPTLEPKMDKCFHLLRLCGFFMLYAHEYKQKPRVRTHNGEGGVGPHC